MQWGYTNYGEVNYAINFANNPLIMLATDSAATNEGVNAVGVANINPHTIILRPTSNNGVVFWLSIGIQQWGLTPALQSSTITFPVETSNSLFIELTPQDSVNGVAVLLELNNKGFNFAINAFNATGYPSVAWLLFGIAQQWRMLEIQATVQNVDFPIAFTEWCVACGSRVTGTGGNPSTLGANAAFSELATLTHAIVFSVETQDYYLLAVGVQQWGLFQTANKQYNAVLSLSYQDWYSPVIAVRQASTEMIGYDNLQLNNFDITLGMGDGSERSGAYLCFGKQQWGCGQHNDNITFSMLYSEIPVTVMGANAYAAYCGIKDNTLTVKGFTGQCCTYSSWSPKSFYWLAIGQQQIKRQHYHYRYHTTLFLQIVYRHHKYQWRHY